ncbi:hypothetical protein [Bradymonas sediminis]|uniref:hypothetical protein n=1 Tax=Bradymonas sediminis TaxID=1548548 RepID=UPI00105FADB1|nr:hypothetical protein [Bradymonas sediminis]
MMRISQLRIAIVATILLLASSHPALAGGPSTPDDPAKIVAAQKHFDEGVAAYQREAYDVALEEFRQAYDQVPAAVFLYNAARMAEKLERLDESLKLAELAHFQIERPLPPPLVEKTNELIERLNHSLAKADAKRKKNIAMKYTPKPMAQAPTPAASAADTERAGHASGWSALGYSGAGIAVVGIGLIGAATYLGADASAQLDELATVTSATDYNERRANIESQQSMGQGFLYSGIATVALGGAFIAWDLMSPTERPSREPSTSGNVSISGVSASISADSTSAGIMLRGVY